MAAAVRRLKKKIDFARIMQIGKRRRVGHFLVLSAPAVTGESRFGVIVSKKISKSAVTRNKLRRQILGALGDIIKSGAERESLDRILVLSRKPDVKDVFTEFKDDLTQICR